MFVLSSLALAVLVQEPAPDVQAKPDVSAIQAAVKALQEAESYTFVHKVVDSGTPMGGPPGGRGGNAPGGRGAAPGGASPDGARGDAAPEPPAPEPVVVTGHVQKGQPLHVVQGEEQAWRDSQGNLVFLEADGSWKALDRSAMRGGFGGGRGGRGGDAPQDPQARDAERAQRETLRARMGLLRVRTAAEVIAGLPAGVGTLSVSKKGERTIYSGALTAEGAAAMGGGGMAMRGGGRGGRGGAQGGGQGGQGGMETTGAYAVVVGAAGAIEAVVVETTTKGSFGDRAIERSRRIEFQISKVGETSLEVPDEVRKALEEAASAGSARERANEEF